MVKNKIKIIEASYDKDLNLSKVKIKKIDDGEESTWVLTGESFDSLIFQITKKSLEYSPEQRELLCDKIIGLEVVNKIEVDMTNEDIEVSKDKNITDLQHCHDIIDGYPFHEAQQEIVKESTKNARKEKK